jgi:hypothetical protein
MVVFEDVEEEIPGLQEDLTAFLGHLETEEALKAEGTDGWMDGWVV